jgi:hypothetical protein
MMSSGKKTSRQMAVESNKRRKLSPGAVWNEAVLFDGNGSAERARKASAVEIESLKVNLAKTKRDLSFSDWMRRQNAMRAAYRREVIDDMEEEKLELEQERAQLLQRNAALEAEKNSGAWNHVAGMGNNAGL